MTLRRSLIRRITAASAALFAIAAVATTGAFPVTFTEASWTDDVYIGASLGANEYAGINSAQAAVAYTLLDRPLTTGEVVGISVSADNTAGATRVEQERDEHNPFKSRGLLTALSYEATGDTCARAGASHCSENDPPGKVDVPIAAFSNFNSFLLESTDPGLDMVSYDSPLPITAAATCTPGAEGETFVSTGGPIKVFENASGSRYKSIDIPESPGTSEPVTVSRLFRYTGKVAYSVIEEVNHARVEIRLNVIATTIPILGASVKLWELDVALAFAECSTSSPIVSLESVPTGARTQAQTIAAVDEISDSPDPQDFDVTSDVPEALEATPTAMSEIPTSVPAIGPLTSPRPSASTRVSTSTTHSSTNAPSTSSPPTTRTTTPTSTRPPVVIPTEPVGLPAATQTVEVCTVEVDEAELDVIVKGDTVPADARAGGRILGNWINDDSTRTGDWKTFTSDDPDEDGWRWAAINRKTGTVVYIR